MAGKTMLLCAMLLLALLLAAALLRAILGPRITDRLLAVNMAGTMVAAELCLLSVYLEADYLLDVALIYAMLSFVGNTVLTRILLQKRRSQKEFEQELLQDREEEETK